MDNLCKLINDNIKKAYKESIIIDNNILQDILLEVLTDMKKICDKEQDISLNARRTKGRYTYVQVKAIADILLQLARNTISSANASNKILKISDRFPVHNLAQYKRVYLHAIQGIGEYGFAFPANWAKALLELTDNDPLIIQALKQQQQLYLDRNGSANATLARLLEHL